VRILVTGGAGFIGSNLLRHLAPYSSLIALDDLSTGHEQNLTGIDAELHVGSILDQEMLVSLSAGCDAIVHLAARPSVPRSIADPLMSHEVNTTGTLNVLEAARKNGIPQVILASSSSVYGANPAIPKDESCLPMPMSPYAVSKLAAEQYALAWQHSYGLNTLAFRFFNVFGPGQTPGHAYAAVVPSFLHAVLTGQPVFVHGDGEQSRDFTYVGTVCDVIGDALIRRVSDPWPVNLAFGTRTSILSLTKILEDVLGFSIERRHVAPRKGDVRHSQADNARLLQLFPDVTPVALNDGLQATLAWMRMYLAAGDQHQD
jgi:UDP-glucose 4-epimerase